MSSLYDNYAKAQSYRENMAATLFCGMQNFKDNIMPHLPKNKSARILDVGCGHGTCVLALQQRGYTCVEGVDISPDQIALARDEMNVQNVFCDDPVDFLEGKLAIYDVIIFTRFCCEFI